MLHAYIARFDLMGTVAFFLDFGVETKHGLSNAGRMTHGRGPGAASENLTPQLKGVAAVRKSLHRFRPCLAPTQKLFIPLY